MRRVLSLAWICAGAKPLLPQTHLGSMCQYSVINCSASVLSKQHDCVIDIIINSFVSFFYYYYFFTDLAQCPCKLIISHHIWLLHELSHHLSCSLKVTRSGNRSSKTFKPKKNIPEGSHRYELLKPAEATLGSGNLWTAVMLPEGEDLNEWVAVNSKGQVYLLHQYTGCIDEWHYVHTPCFVMAVSHCLRFIFTCLLTSLVPEISLDPHQDWIGGELSGCEMLAFFLKPRNNDAGKPTLNVQQTYCLWEPCLLCSKLRQVAGQ